MRKAYLSILWIVTVICIIGGTIYHVGGLVQFAGNNIFSYVTNGGMKKEQAGPLVSDQYDLAVENNRAAIKIQVEDKKEREAEEQNDIIIPTKIDTSDPDEVIKNLRTDNEANGNKEAEKACNCCIIF